MKQRTAQGLHLRGKIGSYIAGFFSVVLVPLTIAYPFEPEFDWGVFIIFIIFTILALFRFWIAFRRLRLSSVYMDYCRAIDISESNKIEEIKRILNLPEDKVVHTLKLMRREKLFPLLVILPNGTVDLSGAYDKNAFPHIRSAEEKLQVRSENSVNVKCPGCGASILIPKNIGGACPYCTTQIKAPR